MLQKSEFEKITGAKRRETREGTEKVGFRGKSGDPSPATRIPMVASDPGYAGRRISAERAVFLTLFTFRDVWPL